MNVDKYKDFETWALKNGWYFLNNTGKLYNWVSPTGFGFTIIVDGENCTAHNTPFSCDIRVAR
jgi:hypothetical protein